MWKEIYISNNSYLIEVTQKNSIIDVFLTNLIEIWTERLTNEIILHRCQTLNPLLNIDALNHHEMVLDILKNIPDHAVEVSIEQIKLQTQVDGVSMKFAIYFSKGTPQDVWENVTKPLCMSSMVLVRQHAFLLELVKKKDEEIAEYKAEGAELIRKAIETKVFMDQQLETDIPTTNVNDCKCAFQRIIQFYDKLNLDKACDTKHASTCSGSTHEAGINNVSKTTGNEDTLIEEEAKSVKSENDEKVKNAISSDHVNSKTRMPSLTYRPIKKLKKGSDHFLL